MPRRKKVKEIDTKEFVEKVGECIEKTKKEAKKTKPKAEKPVPEKPKVEKPKEAKPKKVNPWMVFLRQYRTEHPDLSLKEAMQGAKVEYAEQKQSKAK